MHIVWLDLGLQLKRPLNIIFGIRRWRCNQCGCVRDRDRNAALNILAGAERRPLAEEILALQGGEDVNKHGPVDSNFLSDLPELGQE